MTCTALLYYSRDSWDLGQGWEVGRRKAVVRLGARSQGRWHPAKPSGPLLAQEPTSVTQRHSAQRTETLQSPDGRWLPLVAPTLVEECHILSEACFCHPQP